ncbi:iron-siderophore ABC transporter substrate-binding protein [Pseudonocardia sp. WMMC193]|uniref:iron-siderophore ABC transporter substrate-binding protein n=1 Tax=Pseudonocardia sp. WMMC193 TaxID=2911965 RepID=UPI001F40EAFF|nr:iron-siderophore ABC transporter substrate-binding protein [Pseudonocardia sp. WMMC193]MCF7549591.1 iron-siderophore ABC transporter substrate-binding protein [Pseudonocardia sp. WMMC193]
MKRILGAVALLLVLAGCAGTPAPTEQPQAPAAAFPVTVQHALGSTTIPQQPTRVFTLGPSDADVVLALGVTPVGIHSRYGFERGVGPWAEDKLGTATPTVTTGRVLPLEAIAAAKPDLIINVASSGDKDEYDTLSRIAPTIALPVGAQPYAPKWQDATRLIAQALGKPAEGDTLVADTETYLNGVASANPTFRGKTATYLDVMAGEVYVGGNQATVVTTLKELGFTDTPYVASLPPADTQSPLSAELLPQIDSDILVVYGFGANQADTLASNAGLANLGAVKADHAYFMPDLALSSPSVLSIPYGVNAMLPFLKTATG